MKVKKATKVAIALGLVAAGAGLNINNTFAAEGIDAISDAAYTCTPAGNGTGYIVEINNDEGLHLFDFSDASVVEKCNARVGEGGTTYDRISQYEVSPEDGKNTLEIGGAAISNKRIIFNAKGASRDYTVTLNGNFKDSRFEILDANGVTFVGSAVLENSSIANYGELTIDSEGLRFINEGMYNAESDIRKDYYDSPIIYNVGNLKITNGIFRQKTVMTISNALSESMIVSVSGSSTTISGGEFNRIYDGVEENNGTERYSYKQGWNGEVGAIVGTYGYVVVDGGTFKTTRLENANDTEGSVAGGIFSASGDAILRVTGGTFEGSDIVALSRGKIKSINITGGTFNTTKKFDFYDNEDIITVKAGETAGSPAYRVIDNKTLTYSGVNVTNTGGGSNRIFKADEDILNISGGTFSDTTIVPNNGYIKADAGTDYDGDGINDITVKQGFGIEVGEERMVPNASFYDEDEWRSSDESVCTVNGKGLVRGISAGECVVTNGDTEWLVIVSGGENGPIYTPSDTDMDSIELGIGEDKEISLPEGVTARGAWTTSNASIVKIDNPDAPTITLTGVSEGEAKVIYTDYDGNKYIWTVTVGNNSDAGEAETPNTIDRGVSTAFTIAGAMMAGFGAIVAKVKGFGSRH